MAYYFILSLLLTSFILKIFIDKISKMNFFRKEESNNVIKKTCIQELHKHKENTPTMGGMAIGVSFVICTLVYYFMTGNIIWSNFFIVLFGIMGFADDYIKLKKVRDGVTPIEKLIGLAMISSFFVLYLINFEKISTYIDVPFMNEKIELSLLMYSIFVIFILVASSNSVNITDGLDGLAAGISIIVLIFIGIVSWQMQSYEVFFSTGVLGAACMAMLFFNRYPAKIFMGDTGSLMLGGAIAIFLVRLNIPLWIILILAVCIWEVISVILQLISLKFFKRKIFKIAPYHHHLEKCGFTEVKIVIAFWIITCIFCGIAYMGIIQGGIL